MVDAVSWTLPSPTTGMGRNPEWALLKKAEEIGFEVVITMDTNLTFRLNLAVSRLKIVVLRVRSNRLEDTIPLTPKILQILPYIENGTVTVMNEQ